MECYQPMLGSGGIVFLDSLVIVKLDKELELREGWWCCLSKTLAMMFQSNNFTTLERSRFDVQFALSIGNYLPPIES